MSPVEEKEGWDGKETGINKESGSERVVALSRTMCCPLGGVLGAGTISYLVSRIAAEEAELKLEAAVLLLRGQLAVFTELVGVWVLWFERR